MIGVNARWWAMVAAIAVFVGAAFAFAEHGYLLSVGAVTTQQAPCSFAIGQHAFLLLHVNGEPCKRATSILGRTGRLVFVPDAP